MKKSSIVTWSVVAGVLLLGGGAAAIALTLGGESSRPSAEGTPLVGVAQSPDATDAPVEATPGEPVTSPPVSSTPAPDVPPADEAAAPRAVSPFVTFDQWQAESRTLTVGATVPDLVDAGGTCTLEASRDGTSVSATYTAVASAASTDCGSMSLSDDRLTSGTWDVTVSYSSPAAEGAVTDYEVTIP
jgi:hypothetical protein